ncbi:hypothetical protein SHKM778_25740 [Streptomyces sp. KM77-8]|uniref:Acyl-CoA dehydrogenase/oxidase N-terminal domain-containing protein n=1 Tax=Streptomyces haneummycinicus TaxID=3074435 RepID=A0AAT9HFW6_9ACTN
MIDASPLANLRSYAAQIPALAGRREQPEPDALERLFDLGAELPPYEPNRLDLVVRGADPVLTGLRGIAGPVRAELADPRAAALVRRVSDAVASLGAEAASARRRGADPNALADVAERYAWLHAAAACVHLWWSNRHRPLYGGGPGDSGWLTAVLSFLLARAAGTDPAGTAPICCPPSTPRTPCAGEPADDRPAGPPRARHLPPVRPDGDLLMSQAELTDLARRFEQYLGDPHDPASRMPFTAVLDHDEHDTFPYAFVGMLRRWGFLDYGLPAEQGGKAGNPETGFTLMRLVARRDGATAIALGLTQAAFTPVWIAGTDEQKRRQIADIHGGVGLSWGCPRPRTAATC